MWDPHVNVCNSVCMSVFLPVHVFPRQQAIICGRSAVLSILPACARPSQICSQAWLRAVPAFSIIQCHVTAPNRVVGVKDHDLRSVWTEIKYHLVMCWRSRMDTSQPTTFPSPAHYECFHLGTGHIDAPLEQTTPVFLKKRPFWKTTLVPYK